MYFFINSDIKLEKIKIDYSIHHYCRENEERIRSVFDRSKIMVWDDDDNKIEPNEKRALTSYINQKLESCLGIRISKEEKGGTYNNYVINQLFTLM